MNGIVSVSRITVCVRPTCNVIRITVSVLIADEGRGPDGVIQTRQAVEAVVTETAGHAVRCVPVRQPIGCIVAVCKALIRAVFERGQPVYSIVGVSGVSGAVQTQLGAVSRRVVIVTDAVIKWIW